MSNFSFSQNVFYLFGKLSAIFIKFEIVVCTLSLEKSKTCRLGKGWPNGKILYWFKFKTFADDNINVTQKFKFAIG